MHPRPRLFPTRTVRVSQHTSEVSDWEDPHSETAAFSYQRSADGRIVPYGEKTSSSAQRPGLLILLPADRTYVLVLFEEHHYYSYLGFVIRPILPAIILKIFHRKQPECPDKI